MVGTLNVNYFVAIGTTDNSCEVSDSPAPTEAEIQFILKEIRNYLSADVNGLFDKIVINAEA